MKGIFELKLALPKYTEIWDVNIVLGYLRALPLKQFTLNLTMLLCLTTGQRGQTIHTFDVNNIQEMDDRYRITIGGNGNRVSLGDIYAHSSRAASTSCKAKGLQ